MTQVPPLDGAEPGRLQQIIAWLALGGVSLAMLAFIVSTTLGWLNTNDEIRALAEKAAALQARQEDPTPLIDALGKIKQVSMTSLGYVEGATEEDARVNLEQAISTLLSAGQAQIMSFRRQPAISYGPATGLGFDARLITTSRNVLPLLASFEQARPVFVLHELNLERREDGSIQVGLRGEAYWVPAR